MSFSDSSFSDIQSSNSSGKLRSGIIEMQI